jgi:hypothetical protein
LLHGIDQFRAIKHLPLPVKLGLGCLIWTLHLGGSMDTESTENPEPQQEDTPSAPTDVDLSHDDRHTFNVIHTVNDPGTANPGAVTQSGEKTAAGVLEWILRELGRL